MGDLRVLGHLGSCGLSLDLRAQPGASTARDGRYNRGIAGREVRRVTQVDATTAPAVPATCFADGALGVIDALGVAHLVGVLRRLGATEAADIDAPQHLRAATAALATCPRAAGSEGVTVGAHGDVRARGGDIEVGEPLRPATWQWQTAAGVGLAVGVVVRHLAAHVATAELHIAIGTARHRDAPRRIHDGRLLVGQLGAVTDGAVAPGRRLGLASGLVLCVGCCDLGGDRGRGLRRPPQALLGVHLHLRAVVHTPQAGFQSELVGPAAEGVFGALTQAVIDGAPERLSTIPGGARP